MKKKVIAIVMGTVLTMGALVGCGSSKGADNSDAQASVQEDAQTEESQDKAQEEVQEASEDSDAAETMVEVGGDFPVSTKYAEYQLVEYYIAEMDETPVMVVARTADKTEYQAHFNFFGDEQLLEFTVDGDTCTVTNDLTGFMGKDVDAIYAAIKESDNWQPVQE